MQDAGIALNPQRCIFEHLLLTHVMEMQKSYGAGLLSFHQCCDREAIAESTRMPTADCFLLAVSVAEAIGSHWLVSGWLPAFKTGARNVVPSPLPTSAHLHAFRAYLNLCSPYSAAAWSAALAAAPQDLRLCRFYHAAVEDEGYALLVCTAHGSLELLRDAFLHKISDAVGGFEGKWTFGGAYKFLKWLLSMRKITLQLARFVADMMAVYDAHPRYVPATSGEVKASHGR
ncbi:hypothetical protein B0H17DRAFT_1192505 [Mycena rosella]|uniref:Uncharacterized protein n=1 Tax=Mycena rosella TaxID=1033263 RepID=A0AAD7M9J0_MYCRO|nr:hypothetical protein B0H17DRAFT_1192505 [Mycena rosella]